jgi:hypothetical protein
MDVDASPQTCTYPCWGWNSRKRASPPPWTPWEQTISATIDWL